MEGTLPCGPLFVSNVISLPLQSQSNSMPSTNADILGSVWGESGGMYPFGAKNCSVGCAPGGSAEMRKEARLGC